jgi:HK97 family phage portal protein
MTNRIIDAIRRKAVEVLFGNLSTVDPRLYEHLSGGYSNSGQSVSVNSAMQLSAVWSCVRLISETVATLPLMVYRVDASGRKTVAKDHQLYELLHDAPNLDMTAAEFWESMLACLALWGNAYAEKLLSPAGRVIMLEPLRPDLMRVTKVGRRVRYRYHDPDAQGGYRDFTEDQIFHLKGFGTDGLTGLSPISFARHSLGNAMSVEESVGATFRNMVRPSGILTTDQLLTKAQQDAYSSKLADKFSGAVNSGKVMTLMAGFKFQPIGMPPEDAQMLQTRGFHVEEICRWFRIPPFMIGHTEKVTSWGTGLEQQMIGFLTFALRPYLTRIEQAIRKSLVSPLDVRTITAEFNLEGLLRADSHGRAEFYGAMVNNGLMTRNEIRAKENLPPMPGGDRLTLQINNTFLDLLGAAPAAANQSRQPAAEETVP